MQFPTLSSGLCGISLETGSKLVSWYYLVAGVVELILIITTKEYLVHGDESRYNYVCIVYLVGAGIVQIFNINLLVGLYMRRPSQMRPWIMTKFIFVALILIWYCMTKVAALFDHEWIETPNLIGDIIGIFFQMVVYSHYREVIDQEKRGRNVNSSSELA